MNHEETIFEEALGIDSPAREDFLRNACAGDAAMFQRLQSLLRAHDRAGRFADHVRPDSTSPLVSRSATTVVPLAEKPGDRIGRYKLLQKSAKAVAG